MSLAVLADHMASKGRGPDSMLIHMSPREVQGLQALAENHGGSLTINPETGLPEAGFLDKLLPSIIGAGISYFSGGTIDPATAAMIVGGVQTARTGDIGKGIQAGLGAYGGASLTAGMTAAGADAISTPAAGDAYASLGANAITDAQALAQGFGSAEELMQTKAALAGREAVTAAGPFESLSQGFDAAKKAGPMQYLKANAMPLAAAFGPAILAGANVKNNMPQTVTKPGMITPYNYFGGQYVAGAPYQATPTRAAGGGLMGMDDGGYGPGMLDFTQKSEPVVRMAGGGVPGYAGDQGSLVNDQQIFDYFKGLDQGQLQSGALDQQIARDMETYKVSAADIARATGTQDQTADYGNRFTAADTKNDIYDYFAKPETQALLKSGNDAAIAQTLQDKNYTLANVAAATGTQGLLGDYGTRFVQTLDDPIFGAKKNEYADASDFLKATGAVGLQGQALTNAMQGAGLSAADQYALTHNLADTGGITGTDFYKDIGYTKGALPGDQGGFEGLYANINYSAAGLQKLIDSGKMTVAQAQDAALAEANRVGVSLKDIAAATGKTIGTLFTPKTEIKKDDKKVGDVVCGPGYKKSIDGKTCVPDTTVVTDVVCGPGYKKSIDGKTCVPDTTVITQETSCPTGFHYDPVLKQCVKNLSATQTTTTTVTTPTSLTTAAATSLPVGVSGNTGASIIGGGTTVNPNGTITTSPVIPGIPVGGFTGMEQVRDTYEAGGGSLGVNKNIFVPKTYKELEDRFKLTGGSKQAMDYLTGKTKYNPVPFTEDGQISKSYAESVMKIPVASSSKMYIFKNGKYEVNPDYAIPTYDKDGKKSLNLTNGDVKTFMDKKPSSDAFYTWATTNNLSPEQIALASGRPINEISKLFTGAKDLVGEDGKIDQTKVDEKAEADFKANFDFAAYLKANPDVQAELDAGKANFGTKDDLAAAAYEHYQRYGKAQKRPLKAAGGLLAGGGLAALTMARGGMSQQFDLGGYSDGGRLLRGPGDGVSDSIPATIGNKRPARLADGEFVVPARIVSELGNGSTEAGARKLYAMMDRVQAARRGTVGKGRVAKNSRSDKYLPA